MPPFPDGDPRALLIGMPPEQYDALAKALADGWRIERSPAKIRARYTDLDLADTVPRVIMYLDIGALVGRVRALEAFLIEQGYQLTDE